MNIEESIMYLKIKINTSKKQIESGEIWLDSLVSEEKNSNEAIENLLTAYEKEKGERERIGKLYYEANENCIKYEKMIKKEKEKNKTLEELLQGRLFELYKYYKDLASEYQGNCVSKDKIKPIQIIDLDGKIHNVYKIEEE